MNWETRKKRGQINFMIPTGPQIYEQRFWYIERYALDHGDQDTLGSISNHALCLRGSIHKSAGAYEGAHGRDQRP